MNDDKEYPIAGPQESGNLNKPEELLKPLPLVPVEPMPKVEITLSDEEIKEADKILSLRTGVNWMIKTGMPTPKNLLWGGIGAAIIFAVSKLGCF